MYITKKEMEKLFIKNLIYFKENHPNIHKLVKDHKISRYKIVKKNGKFDIFDNKEKTYLYNFNIEGICDYQIKNLYRFIEIFTYTPNYSLAKNKIHTKIIKSIKNIVSNYEILENKVIKVPKNFFPHFILFGMGPGLILEKLINNLNIKRLFVFEPNIDMFYNSLFILDWENLYSKFDKKEDFIVHIGLSKDFEVNLERHLGDFFKFNPILASYVFVFKHYESNIISKAINRIKSALSFSFRGWGFLEDEKEGFEHSMKNLNRNSKIIFIDKNYKSPKRAFIVGSGPSLDKTIKYIKKYKNSALIFACGTAINPLIENGIIPDFLVELERGKNIKDVLDTVDPQILKRIYLITPDVIHPDVPPMFKDVFYFIRTISVTFSLLNPKTVLKHPYPTVTNAAMSLALTMGIKNIYLFGVDLGFKDTNKYHASNTVYSKKSTKFYKKDILDKNFSLEGNFGGIIYTNDILNWARIYMEKLIHLFKDKDINIYNCSDGVKIAGTLPLKTEKIKLTNINKKEEIEKVIHAFRNDVNKTLNVIPFEETIKSLNSLNKEIFKILNTEITDYENLYYLIENIENTFRKDNKNLGVSIFIRGTIRHILYNLYFSLLKLKNSSDIKIVYDEIRPILIDNVDIIFNEVKSFIKKYEKHYKNLY